MRTPTVSKYYSSDTHEFLKKEHLTEQRPSRPVSIIRNRRKGWSITREVAVRGTQRPLSDILAKEANLKRNPLNCETDLNKGISTPNL